MDNTSIENTDLAKQYQDILDRYSKEMEKPEVPPTPLAPPEPVVKPPEPVLTLPPSPVFESLSPPAPSSSSNIFKYLFLLSLLIFLGVLGTVIYTVVFTKSIPLGPDNAIPTISETVTPSSSEKFCEANGQQFKQGESFKAADGCNSCSCGPDLTIACTLMACEATPSVKVTPTTVKSVSQKSYSNVGVAFQYPSTFVLSKPVASVVKSGATQQSFQNASGSLTILFNSSLNNKNSAGNYLTIQEVMASVKTTPVTVDGYNGLVYKSSDPSSDQQNGWVSFISKDQKYVLTVNVFISKTADSEIGFKILDDIIPTIKFL